MFKKLRQKLQKFECVRNFEHYLYIERPINKIGNCIYKYTKDDTPKLSKEDCYNIAVNILWNDADAMKKILSYTDENGKRIFPR